ncbi:DUF2059 domain-containing protein [Aurantibacter sp.]|uniref:DUF2059 domain-containing protein n=1 Tax=Aurantibacter sp. TaxID=2807103 RepID=UPI0032644F8C
MKKFTFLTFGLFVCCATIVFAQNTTDDSLAASYLEANGSLNQYDYAYSQLLSMLHKQYPETEENTQGWQFLNENKKEAIADMKSLLVPIYNSNFSTSDLKQMINFYQTDTGKQLMLDRTKMSDSQKHELNSYYNTEVGQKIVEKQQSLSAEIAIASENWSRDLYETAVSLLKSE